MNLNPNSSRGKFTDPFDAGTDKYLAKIDAQFDDLRDHFNRIVEGWREDISKLRALVQADIDRMDAKSPNESTTVCRERVAPGGAAPPAAQAPLP